MLKAPVFNEEELALRRWQREMGVPLYNGPVRAPVPVRAPIEQKEREEKRRAESPPRRRRSPERTERPVGKKSSPPSKSRSPTRVSQEEINRKYDRDNSGSRSPKRRGSSYDYEAERDKLRGGIPFADEIPIPVRPPIAPPVGKRKLGSFEQEIINRGGKPRPGFKAKLPMRPGPMYEPIQLPPAAPPVGPVFQEPAPEPPAMEQFPGGPQYGPLQGGPLYPELQRTQEQYLQDLIAGARNQYHLPYSPYEGPLHAKENSQERVARELSARVNAINPYLQRSGQQAQAGTTPFTGAVQDYMNPYQQQVANRIAAEGNRNLTENLLPALEAKFVRLGQHGGSRHADLAARTQREIQSEISARQGQLMHEGYGQAANIFNTDQARRMAGAEHEMNLGQLMNAARLADIRNLQGVGEQVRARQEAPMRSAEQRHLNERRHERERFNAYKSVLSGIPTQPLIQSSAAPAESQRQSFGRNEWQHLGGQLGLQLLANKMFKEGGYVR